MRCMVAVKDVSAKKKKKKIGFVCFFFPTKVRRKHDSMSSNGFSISHK